MSLKVLEIKTSIELNLIFAYNNIWSWFFLFFLIIDLCYLIPAVIAQIINFTAELVIPIEMPTNETNAETETQPLSTEMKIRK